MVDMIVRPVVKSDLPHLIKMTQNMNEIDHSTYSAIHGID